MKRIIAFIISFTLIGAALTSCGAFGIGSGNGNGDNKGKSEVRDYGTYKLITTNEGEVLLVRQFRYPYFEEILEIPAGKLDPDETPVNCGIRELLEETGCRCVSIHGLGIVDENRAYCNFTQRSFYYVVTTEPPYGEPLLTDKERKNRIALQWLPFDQLVDVIASERHSTRRNRFIQARDLAALNEYRKRL